MTNKGIWLQNVIMDISSSIDAEKTSFLMVMDLFSKGTFINQEIIQRLIMISKEIKLVNKFLNNLEMEMSSTIMLTEQWDLKLITKMVNPYLVLFLIFKGKNCIILMKSIIIESLNYDANFIKKDQLFTNKIKKMIEFGILLNIIEYLTFFLLTYFIFDLDLYSIRILL